VDDTVKDGRSDWPGRFEEPYEPTQDDLSLLTSHIAGHDWHPLTTYDGYLAACSCGWHSIETDFLGPTLRQVKDHLDIRQAHGKQPPSPATPAPAAGERDTRQSEALARARELSASAQSSQDLLLQTMERSTALLSEGGVHAAHREEMLKRVKIRASAQTVQGLQRQLEQAKELRKRIAAAAAALAMIEEELAWVHRDHAVRSSSSAAELRCLADEASRSASRAREAERTFRD
jgi:hypothetical protein